MSNKYSEIYKNDVRLNSASDVRRFLSRIINLRANDGIDSETSRDLGYLSNILLKAIEVSSIEDRLEELEKRLGDN